MKKVFLVMMFAVVTAVCAQAQLFVGGSLGVDFTASKEVEGSTTEKGPATFFIEFSPMVGFSLSDNFAVGLKAGLGLLNSNNRADEPTKAKVTLWEFAPFARYTLVSAGDVSLLAEATLGIQGATTKDTRGSTTNEGPSVFGFGFSAMPILSYSFTDKLSIEARPNLFRFVFGVVTTKYPGDSDNKDTDTYLGFGVNPSRVPIEFRSEFEFDTPLFEVGMIFKF